MSASGTPGTASGIVTKLAPRPVSEIVEQLTTMVADRGMKVFAVIDQRREAEQAGLALRDTTLVLFGNPAGGTPVMESAPLSALDLPLKILVWDDRGQTKVSYTDPAALAERYGLSDDLTQRLAGIRALADALAGAQTGP